MSPQNMLSQSLQPRRQHATRFIATTMLAVTLGLGSPLQASDVSEERCLHNLLVSGSDDMTLGEIRAQCSSEDNEAAVAATPGEDGTEISGVNERLVADREAAARPFGMLAHKPNYMLAVAYNSQGWDAEDYQLAQANPGYMNDDVEAQFQISLKVPLALDLVGGRMDIYAAYTNRSFWQVYNSDFSEPFRETNHEPEAWAQFRNDWQVLGFTNVVNAVGIVHQSNGQAGAQSRSWNRLYANFVFERGEYAIGFKPWIWVTGDKDASDNPDIADYLGHGEFRAAWHRNRHVVSLMLRNQLESGFDKGAVEVGWSFPFFSYPYLKGYVQYFYGYGESLIDYDNRVNRLGIGISVTDWFD